MKHEKEISKLNCDFVLMNNDELYEENGISFKSVYSPDGIGEEQTAWIVGYGGKKIFHDSDTIWHNQF